MAYVTTNPPTLLTKRIGDSGGLWIHKSVDSGSQINAAGYFTNGDDLGMKVGDVLFNIDTDNTYAMTQHSVTVVTAGGAATVSAAV